MLRARLGIIIKCIISHYNHFTKYNLSDKQFFECLLRADIENSPQRHTFFTCNPKEIKHILQLLAPNTVSDIIYKAERVLGHSFSILGLGEIKHKKQIDWQLDPVTQKKWPSSIFDMQRPPDIDPKYTAELNRLQHLYPLTQAFILTGNKKFADEIIIQVLDWINSHPLIENIYMRSALEVSLRVIAISWSLNIINYGYKLDRKIRLKVLKSIYLQTFYISEHLKLAGEVNNHLIGEVSCLVIVGVLFPEFDLSGTWIEKGLSILEKEALKQFSMNGANKEGVYYHKFVLDFYTLVIILCKQNKVTISEGLLKSVEKMYEFVLQSVRPDGLPPGIGDNDSGKVFRLDANTADYSSTLATGAALFKRADMKYVSGGFSAESLWLLGTNGYESYCQLDSKKPAEASYALKDTGIYIMRSGFEKDSIYLATTAGMHGIGKEGHLHDDATSFEIYAYGHPVICDIGTYTYNGKRILRDYFRGTKGHNSLIIDNKESSISMPDSAFGWIHREAGETTIWHSSNSFDFIKMVRHYKDEDATLYRCILFVKNEFFIISDIITSEKTHNYELNFHFNDIKPEIDATGNYLLQFSKKEGAGLVFISSETKELKLYKGNWNPMLGWHSENYGKKKASYSLKWTRQKEKNSSFFTIVYPFNNGVCKPISAKLEQGTGYTLLNIETNRRNDLYCIFEKPTSRNKFAQYQTNAEIVYLKRDYKLNISDSLIIGGETLECIS